VRPGDTNAPSDDLLGLGLGIGTGVMGVRIDDFDGDGDHDLWCGDAVGHLWLFRKEANGSFACKFRSDHLGMFPGAYNNLFAIKGVDPADDKTKTMKLVVQGSGYAHLFRVVHSTLP
jgi:hypothetical protein